MITRERALRLKRIRGIKAEIKAIELGLATENYHKANLNRINQQFGLDTGVFIS